MRVAIYLIGADKAERLSCQRFARIMAAALARPEYREIELLFYGDSSILTDSLFNELDAGDVLTDRVDYFSALSASSLIKPLPNGQRCRLVFRVLPSFLPGIMHQLLIPLAAKWDGADVLHSYSGRVFVFSPAQQVVNFWARSGVAHLAEKSPTERISKRSNKSSMLGRAVRIICQSEPEGEAIYRTLGVDPSRISVIASSSTPEAARGEAKDYLSVYRISKLRSGK